MKSQLLSLFAGMAGGILFNVLHIEIYGTQQGVVRLDEILTEHVATIGKEQHTEEQLKTLSAQYAAVLDAVMADYARERVTLFVDQAVVSELPDYTDEIRDRINQALENKKS